MGIVKKFRIKSFKKKNSIIEFDKVSLSFGNRLILDNINFKVNKNLRGIYIGDEITDKVRPLLKKYCNFLISEINQLYEKSTRRCWL